MVYLKIKGKFMSAFFISNAVSADNISSQGSPYSLIIMLIVFGCIFYLMILRPQQKRAKEHKNLMESISKGDEIQTTSGLIGRVTKLNKTGYLTVAVNDKTEIIIKRDFISNILPKGTIKSL